MKQITYAAGEHIGTIQWIATEHFKELENTVFRLGEMEAVKIERQKNLSTTAKILLSAVAGAVIQHMIDKGIATELIFKGTFYIKK